ncbi:hypothetical protein [Marinobacterium jannaschii]|uniref:hypothetical protein n=1 Tax=Marinobacterium jannaschii TaxID=64970 RepID=UPI000B18AE7B|nr:hypothetical protein [Marinobacterium jannaschii]
MKLFTLSFLLYLLNQEVLANHDGRPTVYSLPEYANNATLEISRKAFSRQLNQHRSWHIRDVINFAPTYDRRKLSEEEKKRYSGSGSIIIRRKIGTSVSSGTLVTPPVSAKNRDFDVIIGSGHAFYNDDCSIKKGSIEFWPMHNRRHAIKITRSNVHLEKPCIDRLHLDNDRVFIIIPRAIVNGVKLATQGLAIMDSKQAIDLYNRRLGNFSLIALNPDTDRIERSENCRPFREPKGFEHYKLISTDCDCGSGCSGGSFTFEYEEKSESGKSLKKNLLIAVLQGDSSDTETDIEHILMSFDADYHYNKTIEITDGFIDRMKSEIRKHLNNQSKL